MTDGFVVSINSGGDCRLTSSPPNDAWMAETMLRRAGIAGRKAQWLGFVGCIVCFIFFSLANCLIYFMQAFVEGLCISIFVSAQDAVERFVDRGLNFLKSLMCSLLGVNLLCLAASAGIWVVRHCIEIRAAVVQRLSGQQFSDLLAQFEEGIQTLLSKAASDSELHRVLYSLGGRSCLSGLLVTLYRDPQFMQLAEFLPGQRQCALQDHIRERLLKVLSEQLECYFLGIPSDKLQEAVTDWYQDLYMVLFQALRKDVLCNYCQNALQFEPIYSKIRDQIREWTQRKLQVQDPNVQASFKQLHAWLYHRLCYCNGLQELNWRKGRIPGPIRNQLLDILRQSRGSLLDPNWSQIEREVRVYLDMAVQSCSWWYQDLFFELLLSLVLGKLPELLGEPGQEEIQKLFSDLELRNVLLVLLDRSLEYEGEICEKNYSIDRNRRPLTLKFTPPPGFDGWEEEGISED